MKFEDDDFCKTQLEDGYFVGSERENSETIVNSFQGKDDGIQQGVFSESFGEYNMY